MKIPTGASTWYKEAQDRKGWCAAYSKGAIEHNSSAVMFRREVDKARHKCTAERRRPIHEQRGLVRCSVCGRWFRSRGDLAVHKCSITEEPQM